MMRGIAMTHSRHQQRDAGTSVNPNEPTLPGGVASQHSIDLAALDRIGEFETMIEAVFNSGFYRKNWRSYRTGDNRTAADVCRAVKRSTTPLADDMCELADEPQRSTIGSVARSLLSFYENE